MCEFEHSGSRGARLLKCLTLTKIGYIEHWIKPLKILRSLHSRIININLCFYVTCGVKKVSKLALNMSLRLRSRIINVYDLMRHDA